MWNSNLCLLSSPSINPRGLPCALLGSPHSKTQPSLVPVSGPTLLKYGRMVLELVPECCLLAWQTTESVRNPRDSAVCTTGELASTQAALPETAEPVALMCLHFWTNQQGGPCSSQLKTWAQAGCRVYIQDVVCRGRLADELLDAEHLSALRYFQDFQIQATVGLKLIACLRIMSHIIATPSWMMCDFMIWTNGRNGGFEPVPPFQHGYKLKLAGCPREWWGFMVAMVAALGWELSKTPRAFFFFLQQKRYSLFLWLFWGWNKGWLGDSHGFLLLVSCLATVGTLL